jgi:hypothetical protein
MWGSSGVGEIVAPSQYGGIHTLSIFPLACLYVLTDQVTGNQSLQKQETDLLRSVSLLTLYYPGLRHFPLITVVFTKLTQESTHILFLEPSVSATGNTNCS